MSSQSFASELVAHLVALGARDFFLAPGSRSQALALAAHSLSESGEISLTVRIDERSLAFTALGSALATDSPSVLITTSGTAVANLHPAVLEAHHSGVPLILLTADRPKALRNKGANQTTNQVGIFNDAVLDCFDVNTDSDAKELALKAVSLAFGKHGPVQINIQFSEPLSSLEPTAISIFASLERQKVTAEQSKRISIQLSDASKTVVVAGAGAGRGAVELATKYGLPLFAEPSSRARYSDNAVLRFAELLNQELANQIEQVIVFGKPTLSRSVVKLIQRADMSVQVVRDFYHGHFDVGSNAKNFADQYEFDSNANPDWLQFWKDAEQKLERATGFSRASIVEQLWENTADSDSLVLGASKLIREADRFAPAKPVHTFANRGLAGIDGTISTAIGIALHTKGTTRALIGDLTFIHDVGGLNLSDIPKLNLQLWVVNDRGGKIFEQLEVFDSVPSQAYNRLFRTEQNVNLESLSAGFGWNFAKVNSSSELDAAASNQGFWVFEIELS